MTLRSMTAFASATGSTDGLAWTLDAKSVNARGLDLKLRLPTGFDAQEAAIRGMAKARLTRGTVTLTLRLERAEPSASHQIDEEVFAAYARQISNLVQRSGYAQPDIGAILRLPGVLGVLGVTVDAAQTPDLTAEFERLLDDLVQAREAEGEALAQVLNGQLAEMRRLVDEGEQAAANRPQARQARLKDVVAALNVTLDDDRLEQEIALLAVKIDVTEEIDRLRAHLATGEAILKDDGPAGRRLEFLAQEMNREANTLCAKAADADLTRIGMALKLLVDQFREQALNIE